MLGSPNPHQRHAPLAMRLKVADLHAQLAPLDRYGVAGLSSAMTGAVRALVRGFKTALRGPLYCALGAAATARRSDRTDLIHLTLRLAAVILAVALVRGIR